jgi:ribosomal protein L22
MQVSTSYTYLIKNIDISPKKINLLLKNGIKSKKSLNFSKLIKEFLNAQNNAVNSLNCNKNDLSIISIQIQKGKTYTKQIAGFKGIPQIRKKIKSTLIIKFIKK